MTAKPLVVFGAGELAEVACWYFEHDGGRRVAAFTIDGDWIASDTLAGKPVVEFTSIEAHYPPAAFDFFVAVGYSRVNGLREQKCLAALAKGYELASYVSPLATVAANAEIGWNAFVLEDCTIQPFVTIGNGVTLWSRAIIGHHVRIGDFVFISSNVMVAGGVKVGERTFIGVNSTINDHLTIGQRCVIGSASLVTKDLADESVVSAEAARLSPVPSRRLKGF